MQRFLPLRARHCAHHGQLHQNWNEQAAELLASRIRSCSSRPEKVIAATTAEPSSFRKSAGSMGTLTTTAWQVLDALIGVTMLLLAAMLVWR